MDGIQRSIVRVVAVRVAALAFLLGAAVAHDGVHFELALESPGFPDLDAHPVIDGEVGSLHLFTANMILSLSDIDQGVQGWSCGVRNEGVEIVSITVEGTVSAYQADGGLVGGLEDGFVAYEIIDPHLPQNGGRSGMVQAIVLTFRGATVLAPNASHLVGKNLYRARVESAGRTAFIRYEDSLVGTGEPIPNDVTIAGETVHPTLEQRQISIGQGAPPMEADCRDGLDNDGDESTDCSDPDCYGLASCPAAEICTDGIDNDGDALADCDDPDCSTRLYCGKVELCTDGIDNDGDQAADCDDSQCKDIPPCAMPEDCFDGADNDGDSLVDCDDPDCDGASGCGVGEDCHDGMDNNGDRRTDCEDPWCKGVPPCPPAEICTDGFDNDGDLWTDCDDTECEFTIACREREVCDDGLDNDRDGQADCDDWDCRLFPACPSPEVCGDGIDNDGDSRTDCDDPECEFASACLDREVCNDGLDNNYDGLVDCDDWSCKGRSPCPAGEICGDALDNDADELADCEDPDCALAPSCWTGTEGGFDLVLSAKGYRREGEKNVVEVDLGDDADVEVVTLVVPFPGPQSEGVQGWSVSVAHNQQVLTIDSVTIDGTAAAMAIAGGFEATEIAGQGGGGGREEAGGFGGGDGGEGFVSAVVLSFKKPLTLDPRRPQSIARSTYVLLDGLGDPKLGAAMVHFQDGLTGSGEPVPNGFTVNGETERPLHRIPLEVRRVGSGAPFVRGDVNDDGKVNIADAIWSVNELLRQGPRSGCRRTGDVNADTLYDLSDVVYLISWGFLHGPEIPLPFPTCGVSYGPKSLECPEGSYVHCP